MNIPRLNYKIEVEKNTINSNHNGNSKTSKINDTIDDSENLILKNDNNANQSSTHINENFFPDRYQYKPDVTFNKHIDYENKNKYIRVKSNKLEQEVSAQQIVPGGKYKDIEIKNVEDTEVDKEYDIPPRFKLLGEALTILQQKRIFHITNTFKGSPESDYIMILGQTSIGNYAGIVEYNNAEEKNISTLIISSKNSCKYELNKQIKYFEHGNGHWNKDNFINNSDNKYYLLKHFATRNSKQLAELLSKHIYYN